MTNSTKNIFNKLLVPAGLLTIIGVTVVTAGILVYVLPEQKQNSDAAKGFLTLVSSVITGCFALLQANQNQPSSSDESRLRLDNLQKQIEQVKTLEPLSNQLTFTADNPTNSPKTNKIPASPSSNGPSEGSQQHHSLTKALRENEDWQHPDSPLI